LPEEESIFKHTNIFYRYTFDISVSPFCTNKLLFVQVSHVEHSDVRKVKYNVPQWTFPKKARVC